MATVTRAPAEVFPPGEFVQDELEARNWTQADLGTILGRNVRLVNEIINGKRSITVETAKGLAAAFGTTAQFWLSLQTVYDLSQTHEAHDSVARRARLYSKAPVKDLIRRHWIERSDNVEVLEKRIMDFFGIEDLKEALVAQPHAARKSTPYDSATPAQVAWLRRVEQLASAVLAKPYAPHQFSTLVGEVRKLLESPEEARHLPRVLADHGIRFLVVEPLPQTKIDGACFWMNKKAPVIALSLRYDRIDYFWYTVAHELDHVKNLDGAMDIELLERNGKMADERPASEKEADTFAAEMLIPQSELEDFISRARPLYSSMRIRGFAARIGVHPGIVVGQLQYRDEISYAQHRKLLVPVRGIVTEAALTDGWNNTLPVAI